MPAKYNRTNYSHNFTQRRRTAQNHGMNTDLRNDTQMTAFCFMFWLCGLIAALTMPMDGGKGWSYFYDTVNQCIMSFAINQERKRDDRARADPGLKASKFHRMSEIFTSRSPTPIVNSNECIRP
jgi:hypothetical protein